MPTLRLTFGKAWSSGWTRLSIVAALVLSLGLCTSPLLGIFGVESALFFSLALSPFVLAACANLSAKAHALGEPTVFMLKQCLHVALSTLVAGWCVLALNSVRIGPCDVVQGFLFHVMGPAFSLLLAAALGAVIGVVVPPRLAPWLGVAIPFFEVALALYRFKESPAIYAYGHFFGYFPGTFYDRRVVMDESYLYFRWITFFWIVACFLVVALLRLRLTQTQQRSGLAVTLLLIALALSGDFYGVELGHRSSPRSLTQALGKSKAGKRCTVVVPRELEWNETNRLAADCDFRVAHAEHLLGTRQKAHIHAYFFRDATEKRKLMGASDTYVAKPWRNEVYLNLEPWPHPVLAHEIAHVVAGSFGRGPFRISGTWGGLWPHVGWIEGLAVAVAWDSKLGLTPHEWAQALIRIGHAPSLHKIMGRDFVFVPADRAYTLAGSFVRYVVEHYGNDAVRNAYSLADIESALGKSLATLEGEWKRYLQTIPISERTKQLALLRFSTQSVFHERCAHQTAMLREQLRLELSAGNLGRAERLCGRLIELEPRDWMTRSVRIETLFMEGKISQAMAALSALQREEVPLPIISRVEERLADVLWSRGKTQDAARIYERLLKTSATEDAIRRLEVKQLALLSSSNEQTLFQKLFVQTSHSPLQPLMSLTLTHRLALLRSDGLGLYLEARQLSQARLPEFAVEPLELALQRKLPSAALHKEAVRLYAMSLYAQGDFRASNAQWRILQTRPEATLAEIAEATDWLERIQQTN